MTRSTQSARDTRCSVVPRTNVTLPSDPSCGQLPSVSAARTSGNTQPVYDSSVAATDRRETDAGIEVKPVYTDDDVAELELELPREFPFTRGPYPTMYRGR